MVDGLLGAGAIGAIGAIGAGAIAAGLTAR